MRERSQVLRLAYENNMARNFTEEYKAREEQRKQDRIRRESDKFRLEMEVGRYKSYLRNFEGPDLAERAGISWTRLFIHLFVWAIILGIIVTGVILAIAETREPTL